LAKSIDRDVGPLIYNLSADEIPVVQGINDAGNSLGSDLDAAFAGVWREWAELEKLSGPLAKKAMSTANNNHRRDFINSFKDSAGVDLGKIVDPKAKVGPRTKIGGALVSRNLLIDQYVNAPFAEAVAQNVALIKTIGPQYLDQVEKVIYEGIRSGMDGHSIKREVLKVNGQNYNRAKLIARDQMQKFNSALSGARQQSIGVTGYIWRTSQDDRVRDSHRGKDGLRFDWNAPPSDTGHPGEDIQCRCTAEPDLGSISPWVRNVIG
jgi:SPP1 gp7 family putative phage head morphogenesis protein